MPEATLRRSTRRVYTARMQRLVLIACGCALLFGCDDARAQLAVGPSSLEILVGAQDRLALGVTLSEPTALSVTCAATGDATVHWRAVTDVTTVEVADASGRRFTASGGAAMLHDWVLEVGCDGPGALSFECTSEAAEGVSFSVTCAEAPFDAGPEDAGPGPDGGVEPLPVGFLLLAQNKIYSFDGAEYRLLLDRSFVLPNELAVGPTGYLAVGTGILDPFVLYRSPDGRSWTRRTPTELEAPQAPRRAVVTATRLVMSVERRGIMFSDDDGETWTDASVAPPRAELGASVAFGDGVFVTSTGGASSDGDAWVAAGAPPEYWTVAAMPSVNSEALAFGAGRFVMVAGDGTRGYTASTTDGGVTWTEGTAPATGSRVADLAFGDGAWVVACDDAIWRSTDGVTFVEATPPSFNGARAIAYREGFGFAAVGASLWTSPDGVTWTRSDVAFPFDPTLNAFRSIAPTQ